MKQFNFNVDDVSMEAVKRAFYNTSFDPERRGEEVRKNYVEHMQATFEKLQAVADTDEQKSIILEELERYKIGYIKKLTDWLHSKSNCASAMITGPAKFPVEKNRKRMQSAQNKYTDLCEYSKKSVSSIIKKIDNARNENQITNDEFKRLKNEFDKYMRWNNGRPLQGYQVPLYTDKIKRSFKNKNYEAVKMLLEYIKEHQLKNGIVHFSPRHSVWKLAEVETVEQEKATEKTGETVLKEFSNGVKIINNYDDERIRIYFNGKPADEIRTQLKQKAFKWSPNAGAWQRKNTNDAIYAVKSLLQVLEGATC